MPRSTPKLNAWSTFENVRMSMAINEKDFLIETMDRRLSHMHIGRCFTSWSGDIRSESVQTGPSDLCVLFHVERSLHACKYDTGWNYDVDPPGKCQYNLYDILVARATTTLSGIVILCQRCSCQPVVVWVTKSFCSSCLVDARITSSRRRARGDRLQVLTLTDIRLLMSWKAKAAVGNSLPMMNMTSKSMTRNEPCRNGYSHRFGHDYKYLWREVYTIRVRRAELNHERCCNRKPAAPKRMWKGSFAERPQVVTTLRFKLKTGIYGLKFLTKNVKRTNSLYLESQRLKHRL